MPIAQVYVTVLAISVPMSLNVDTMDELIALARAQPGKLNAAAHWQFRLSDLRFHQIDGPADRESAVSRHHAGAERSRRGPH
jgi:hypothetical protein